MSRLHVGLLLLPWLVMGLVLACGQAESPQTAIPAPVTESTPVPDPTEIQAATPAPAPTEVPDSTGIHAATPAPVPTDVPNPTHVPVATGTPASPLASTILPVTTNYPRPDPTIQGGASIDTSGCRGCKNAAELIAVRLSDTPLAIKEYFGKWIRLGGRVVSVSGSGGVLKLEVPMPGGSSKFIHLQGKSKDGWLEWVLSHDPGDVVEANCLIRENPSGDPLPVNCMPVRN